MTTSIRKATPSDEDAIVNLIHELFEPPGGVPAGFTEERAREGVRYALDNPSSDILLAVEDDTVVGMASVYKDYFSIRDGWRTWLQDLVVTSERRSSGIGSELLSAAADWARGHGCTHLDLASGLGRKDAHRFYERESMLKASYDFRLQLDQ
ncbi:MAG: GNAT family N-acetyltransferase [Chloroflexi bacterium]|nr:GNAT family N-acetyltransferase [Chloroflexota bacterium]